jgi:hypothetical protein
VSRASAAALAFALLTALSACDSPGSAPGRTESVAVVDTTPPPPPAVPPEIAEVERSVARAMEEMAGDTAAEAPGAPEQGGGSTIITGGTTTVVMDGVRYTMGPNGIRVDTLHEGAGRGGSRIVTRGGSYVSINGVRYQFREDGSVVRIEETAEAADPDESADDDRAVAAADPPAPPPPGPADSYRAADEALWRTVREWRGRGSRTTESFQIRAREWRLVFGAEPVGRGGGSHAVYVFNRAGRRVADASRPGRGTDTSYVHGGPGIYYLDIDGNDVRWSVAVQEKAPAAERIAP